jgi:hypothetical protein
MDKELFEQLTQSMKEAIAIAKGELKPSRVFTVEAPDVNGKPFDDEFKERVSSIIVL